MPYVLLLPEANGEVAYDSLDALRAGGSSMADQFQSNEFVGVLRVEGQPDEVVLRFSNGVVEEDD